VRTKKVAVAVSAVAMIPVRTMMIRRPSGRVHHDRWW
jgi:hypothetical protein